MQLELVRMLDANRYGLAAAYATASLVAGYLALYIATAMVRRVRLVV
jgi:CrcB protein